MTHTIPVSRRTLPSVRVTDIRFVYSRGADVQTTWRRFGWVPPSETKPAIPDQSVRALQTSQL